MAEEEAPPAATPAADEVATPAAAPDKVAETMVQEAGLDLAALQQEVDREGTLTPESRARLKERLDRAGIPEAVMDEYIEGRKATVAAKTDEVLGAIGGREEYDRLLTWGKANLTPAECSAFDRAVTGGGWADVKLAVVNLHARYKAATSAPAALVRGHTVPAAPPGFGSREEMVEAMSDPRYRTSETYRRQVVARVAASPGVRDRR